MQQEQYETTISCLAKIIDQKNAEIERLSNGETGTQAQDVDMLTEKLKTADKCISELRAAITTLRSNLEAVEMLNAIQDSDSSLSRKLKAKEKEIEHLKSIKATEKQDWLHSVEQLTAQAAASDAEIVQLRQTINVLFAERDYEKFVSRARKILLEKSHRQMETITVNGRKYERVSDSESDSDSE